jgi:hypothetical protein
VKLDQLFGIPTGIPAAIYRITIHFPEMQEPTRIGLPLSLGFIGMRLLHLRVMQEYQKVLDYKNDMNDEDYVHTVTRDRYKEDLTKSDEETRKRVSSRSRGGSSKDMDEDGDEDTRSTRRRKAPVEDDDEYEIRDEYCMIHTIPMNVVV